MLRRVRVAAVLCCAAAAFIPAKAAETDFGELSYINCEAGFGIEFPAAPMVREIQFTTNTGRMVPARQFYVQRGQDLFQVTVARFNYGPPIDEAAMDHAAAALKARGQVRREEVNAAYDPGFPGRQLSVALPGGRFLRASVYMMEHKLYITEAVSDGGDPTALQFEQSITMVNEMGIDYDQNPPDPIHRLNCRTGNYFRR
jgi:hypothetical protein